jgi:hypothetical protein
VHRADKPPAVILLALIESERLLIQIAEQVERLQNTGCRACPERCRRRSPLLTTVVIPLCHNTQYGHFTHRHQRSATRHPTLTNMHSPIPVRGGNGRERKCQPKSQNRRISDSEHCLFYASKPPQASSPTPPASPPRLLCLRASLLRALFPRFAIFPRAERLRHGAGSALRTCR